jgi:hypothetical protein
LEKKHVENLLQKFKGEKTFYKKKSRKPLFSSSSEFQALFAKMVAIEVLVAIRQCGRLVPIAAKEPPGRV